MRVEVVYALPRVQDLRVLELEPGASVGDAIAASGLLDRHPTLRAGPLSAGINGELADLARPLAEGDRVEIYRALRADPREARRVRSNRTRR